MCVRPILYRWLRYFSTTCLHRVVEKSHLSLSDQILFVSSIVELFELYKKFVGRVWLR